LIAWSLPGEEDSYGPPPLATGAEVDPATSGNLSEHHPVEKGRHYHEPGRLSRSAGGHARAPCAGLAHPVNQRFQSGGFGHHARSSAPYRTDRREPRSREPSKRLPQHDAGPSHPQDATG